MIKRKLAPFALGIALAIPAHAAPAPNIVLMLVDDLGWQDVKCYDIDEPSPMETPNLDALAKRGVLFRSGYSAAPTCSPSRCAIMSGNHRLVTLTPSVIALKRIHQRSHGQIAPSCRWNPRLRVRCVSRASRIPMPRRFALTMSITGTRFMPVIQPIRVVRSLKIAALETAERND